MARAPVLYVTLTDADLDALLTIKRRWPYLSEAAALRWGLAVLASAERPVPAEPPLPPKKGRTLRRARSAAMRAYLDAQDHGA